MKDSKINTSKIKRAIDQLQEAIKPEIEKHGIDDLSYQISKQLKYKILSVDAVKVLEFSYSLAKPSKEVKTLGFNGMLYFAKDSVLFDLDHFSDNVAELAECVLKNETPSHLKLIAEQSLEGAKEINSAIECEYGERMQVYRSELDELEGSIEKLKALA